MPRTADRCKETSTTTGTGTLTLGGAASQFQSFATAFGAASVTVQYAIVGQSGTEWEVGVGTFNGTTSLTRDTVYASSNSGAAVNLSAGTKDVFATEIAAQLNASNGGRSYSHARGMMLQ